MLLSLEGNIGSGKSTLMNELKKKVKGNVVFIDEPVSQWLDIQGVNMIERFYGDKKRYSFLFQAMAFVTRMEMLDAAMETNKTAVFITERCLSTDELFAEMLHEDGLMDDVEFDVYTRLVARFSKRRPHVSIYLKSEPEMAMERCVTRNREGENITIEYLRKCHAKHEEWAKTSRPVVLDAADDLSENVDRIVQLL